MSGMISESTRPRARATRREREAPGLRALDGVIMLSSDGRPASGLFPDNVWVVMGSDDDCIEEFFGAGRDVLTAGLEGERSGGGTRYCVGFDAGRQRMMMNGDGAYPVYVSGLLRLRRDRVRQ